MGICVYMAIHSNPNDGAVVELLELLVRRNQQLVFWQPAIVGHLPKYVHQLVCKVDARKPQSDLWSFHLVRYVYLVRLI